MNFQNCSICGGSIEKGFLESRGWSDFIPDGKKILLHTQKALEKINGIKVTPNYHDLSPEWPDAYVCRNCKIVIIPYE